MAASTKSLMRKASDSSLVPVFTTPQWIPYELAAPGVNPNSGGYTNVVVLTAPVAMKVLGLVFTVTEGTPVDGYISFSTSINEASSVGTSSYPAPQATGSPGVTTINRTLAAGQRFNLSVAFGSPAMAYTDCAGLCVWLKVQFLA